MPLHDPPNLPQQEPKTYLLLLHKLTSSLFHGFGKKNSEGEFGRGVGAIYFGETTLPFLYLSHIALIICNNHSVFVYLSALAFAAPEILEV